MAKYYVISRKYSYALLQAGNGIWAYTNCIMMMMMMMLCSYNGVINAHNLFILHIQTQLYAHNYIQRYTNMAPLKQIVQKAVATQYQPIPPEINQKAFEILEKAGGYAVSDNKDPMGMIYAALYAAQIIKSRE
jgi:DNA phosphorothioation-dependent restriction protein DptG